MSGNRIVSTQNQLRIGNQSSGGARKGTSEPKRRLWRTAVLLGSLLLSVSLCAQTANSAAPLSDSEFNSPTPLKLPVAHAHFGSWCVGYLTIGPDEVRYDAIGPHGKDQHSFQLKRDQVVFLNYWVLAGQPMNAVEMRTANKTYHFWLMQSEADLQGGRSAWNPVAAAPSDTLLVTLYYWRVTGYVPTLTAINAVMVQARAAAANAAMAQAGAPGATVNGDAWQKLNDHMFVNNYASQVTSHTMSTINHISHW